MNKLPSIGLLAIGGIAAAIGFAQVNPTTTGAVPTPKSDLPLLQVSPARISESRDSTGSGSTTLSLSVKGHGLPATATVRSVIVTKAVDDKDRSLVVVARGGRGSGQPGELLSSNLGRPTAAGPVDLSVSARIQTPLRSATSIKYVEGTIEIFGPTEATGSLVRIPNIMSHSGRVEHPALAKHGIEYRFLADQAAYDEAALLLSRIPAQAAPVFPNDVGYFMRDTSRLIVGYQLQDAAGSPLLSQGGSGSSWDGAGSTIGSMRYDSRPPKDAQLILILVIPEAIKTVPFRFEDIQLP